MERVLWPMEPVEPRIASFFTRLIFSEWSGLVLRYVVGEGIPLGCIFLQSIHSRWIIGGPVFQ